MARALAKRAQSFARKDHEVNDFTMPEDRFERMQEMGRAHYAVHQTVDARDMETHIDSQMDDMRQSHDPDDSKDDASTFGAKGRAFLLEEFERMVRAAIKIQRAFRKFAIKCKEKGVWPSDDKFRQAKGLIKVRYESSVSFLDLLQDRQNILHFLLISLPGSFAVLGGSVYPKVRQQSR